MFHSASSSELPIHPNAINSCFFNSSSSVYSKNEVITLVVIGVLGLLVAGAGLYGYLGDPSWLIGAHILTGATLLTFALAGLLVLTKWIQSRHLEGRIESGLEDSLFRKEHDDTPPAVEVVRHSPDHAMDLIFGSKGKTTYKSIDIGASDFQKAPWDTTEKMSGVCCHGQVEEGNRFSVIKYQTQSGIKGDIVIFEQSNKSWELLTYSEDKGKTCPHFASFFGYPPDIAFLSELVQKGRSKTFELRR